MDKAVDKVYRLVEASNQLQPQPDHTRLVAVRSEIQERLDRLAVVRNQLPVWLVDAPWGEEFALQAERLESSIQQRLDLELSNEGIESIIPNARDVEEEEEDDEEMEDEEEVDGTKGTSQDAGSTTRLQRSVTKFFNRFRLKGIRLMRAAKAGNHRRVEKLLKDGADPNTKTLQWTPLMWASHRGHGETVKILLQHEADPNITTTNGYTALMLASPKGHHDVVRLLLDPGNRLQADVNARNNTRGWSALMWACQTYAGTFGTKRRFLTEEAMENRRKVAKVLLEAGADVNLVAKNGWSPLMQASQDGDVEMVKILARAKDVKIDHLSLSTWSALTTACRKGHEDIVQVLVDAGASANLKKRGGMTALHIACYKGLVRAVKSLVAGGADVDVQDDWGITPLILAVKQNDLRLMKYLIVDAKADVNIRAEKYAQWSALFFAVKNGDQEAVDLLINNRTETCIKDEYGHTPLSYSKGLFLQKKVQMYKHLVSTLFPEEGECAAHTPDMRMNRATLGGKSFTELLWRGRQLPNLLFNI